MRFLHGFSSLLTKTTIFVHKGDYPTSISKLHGKTIDNVSIFRYLGAQIDYKNHFTGDTEINTRIDSAEGKFYQHGRKFTNENISLKTRVTLLNSLVRSRLTYGCQVWSLTANQYGLLNATYNRMLRIMVRNGFKLTVGLSSSLILRCTKSVAPKIWKPSLIDSNERMWLI